MAAKLKVEGAGVSAILSDVERLTIETGDGRCVQIAIVNNTVEAFVYGRFGEQRAAICRESKSGMGNPVSVIS